MIDALSILLFSALIVYTVFRAVKLDKTLPWFTSEDEQAPPQDSQHNIRKQNAQP